MKTYPQPSRSAGSNAPLVEIPPRGNRPARRGAFWPGESFGTCTRKWDLSGVFLNQALVLPALVDLHGPQPR